ELHFVDQPCSNGERIAVEFRRGAQRFGIVRLAPEASSPNGARRARNGDGPGFGLAEWWRLERRLRLRQCRGDRRIGAGDGLRNRRGEVADEARAAPIPALVRDMAA